MKILVIDDTQVHIDAAKQTLGGHDVTYCVTHKQAVDLLGERNNSDQNRYNTLMKQYEAEGMKWGEAYNKANAETLLPYWDVVLTDLLMPAGPMAQGGVGLQYVGQEMAVGWALALQAAKNGAKHVAVVTDTNHHHHPASAMLDYLDGHFFMIDGARVLMTNHVGLVGIAGTEGACAKCNGSGKDGSYDCHYCSGTGRDFAKKGKNWGQILGRLLKSPGQE